MWRDSRFTAPRVDCQETEAFYLAKGGTEMVADSTGGSSIRFSNDLVGGLDQIAAESSTYYLLGYQPREGAGRELAQARSEGRAARREGANPARLQATPPPALALAPPVNSENRGRRRRARRRKPPSDRSIPR